MANDSDADDRDGLDVLGVLAEPTRRRVYDHVVANGDWVSRESVAAALGLERPTVAHHLDRLAGDGLLEVEFRRLTGRQGPGAGRPAKLYRRSAKELSVSIPPRDYHLAGRLLAEAADRSRLDGVPIGDALDEAAAAAGRRLGGGIRQRIETATAAEAVARREITLAGLRSEEHTSELQSLMRNSYT